MEKELFVTAAVEAMDTLYRIRKGGFHCVAAEFEKRTCQLLRHERP